ncbi:MAG: hypothetical protein HYZ49_04680 [Chloroflexi bacterium]|nr:hypothetical protein [Chloroflexota bacterium]
MFIPGYPATPFPLTRHLPPLDDGIMAVYGDQHSAPGDLVIDPFAQSPRAALELARAGRRVLLVNNNPVLRLALMAAIDPVPVKILKLALTRLADTLIVKTRLEEYLRNLYRSTCPDCGHAVEVDFFTWEKEALAEKFYHCPTCGEDKTRPTDPADAELAARYAPDGKRGPHYFWALDRAASPDDPDRQIVADALETYTARALHAIFTLTYKSGGLTLHPPERRALDLLLLMAYDEGSSLDGVRPRTLKPHTRFREKNLWLTLERSASDGAFQGEAATGLSTVSVPDLMNKPNPAVAMFEGTMRDLNASGLVPPKCAPFMITALPRPNAVLWILTAIWAAWLWEQEAAKPLKKFISRKRYDWSWHEQALRAGFSASHKVITRGGRFVVLLPEADPGFVGAALTAADAASFSLIHHAIRAEPAEAQFTFQPDQLTVEPPGKLTTTLRLRAEAAALEVMRQRGEPVRWATISGAAFVAFSQEHLLRIAVEESATEPLDVVTEAIEAGCVNSPQLIHVGVEESEADSPRAGRWWLADSEGAADPLADRVEREVAHALADMPEGQHPDTTTLERHLCTEFPGLLTPGSAFFRRCLESYGVEKDGVWHFRPEDEPMARADDYERMSTELKSLGQRLGYEVKTGAVEINWLDADSELTSFRFIISDTAAVARHILPPPTRARQVMVIPGGRAGLIQHKLGRDAHLRQAVDAGGWLFLKFRHVRRLLEKPNLDRAAFLSALGLDPIVDQGSEQLPLL